MKPLTCQQHRAISKAEPAGSGRVLDTLFSAHVLDLGKPLAKLRGTRTTPSPDKHPAPYGNSVRPGAPWDGVGSIGSGEV